MYRFNFLLIINLVDGKNGSDCIVCMHLAVEIPNMYQIYSNLFSVFLLTFCSFNHAFIMFLLLYLLCFHSPVFQCLIIPVTLYKQFCDHQHIKVCTYKHDKLYTSYCGKSKMFHHVLTFTWYLYYSNTQKKIN